MTSLRQDYLAELSVQAEAKAQYILSGRCEDFVEYRNAVGYIQGLNAARSAFEDVWKSQDG